MPVKYTEIGEHLVVDPRVCFGKLTFKGTRVPVETVLVHLGKHGSVEAVLKSWPGVSRRAVDEALELAASALVDVTGAAPTYGDLEPPRPWRSPRRRRKTSKAGNAHEPARPR